MSANAIQYPPTTWAWRPLNAILLLVCLLRGLKVVEFHLGLLVPKKIARRCEMIPFGWATPVMTWGDLEHSGRGPATVAGTQRGPLCR